MHPGSNPGQASNGSPPMIDDATPDVLAAYDLQRRLAAQVVRADTPSQVSRVTGVDAAYTADDRRVIAAAVTLDADTLAPLETAVATAEVTFPYVPGLFSFRELPCIRAVLDRLDQPPQLVVCDGQGVAHPRRLGLASHLGVEMGLPTIGCAKSRLVGEHQSPAKHRGARAPLIDEGETIGAVLRTQDGVRPVYVSVGHLVSLETACAWVLRLSPRHRLPETTRTADHAVRLELRRLVAESLSSA